MTQQTKEKNDKSHEEIMKLKFIDKHLNDGWVIYKKRGKYHFLKNKEIFKNKNIDISNFFQCDDNNES